jgi:outer membrane protein assembly factor BamB
LNKTSLSICITVLFTASVFTPMTIGYNNVKRGDNLIYNQQLDQYNNSWYLSDGRSNNQNNVSGGLQLSDNTGFYTVVNEKSPLSSNGPMNSPWPMLSHDLHHTGQSPYSTTDNLGFEKWWFKAENYLGGSIESSAVIDNNGIIYFGSMGADHHLYALYPNGTKKWSYYDTWIIWSTPAIDENGVIYASTTLGSPDYLHAIYTNNCTLKWKYPISGTFSSPAIADDGTIVFGDDNWRIIALYPNGTEKWYYPTGNFVASSPAIADDGTIYCGSSDNYLYALYPNGTLRWKFGTGGWIKGHPSITEDGTVYVPSFDGNLYALYPNGTLKWSTDYGDSVASAGAVIGPDSTLYVGTNALRAFYPENGSLKWCCDIGGNLYGSVPAVSADGTIYVSVDFGGSGGDLVAVNPDGTIKWRQHISNEYARSSPCIGEDGTIYVGSTTEDKGGYSLGYLHAFNQMNPDAPSAPIIDGLSSGKAGKEYNYTFTSISPVGRDVFYYVDWGDGYWTDWIGPYGSGETAFASHTWKKDGNYTISARSKDTDNLWGPWGEFKVSISPKNRVSYSSLFLRFLERFPIFEKLFSLFFHFL